MLMKSKESFSLSISFSFLSKFEEYFAAGICLLKLNKKNSRTSRTRCVICLKINGRHWKDGK